VENIPSREGGRLRLRFAFADRRAARALVTGIQARRAEFRLTHFESELERMSGTRTSSSAPVAGNSTPSTSSLPPRQSE
jgi:hypothetical protein